MHSTCSRCKVIHLLSGGVATDGELPHVPDSPRGASPLHRYGYIPAREW